MRALLIEHAVDVALPGPLLPATFRALSAGHPDPVSGRAGVWPRLASAVRRGSARLADDPTVLAIAATAGQLDKWRRAPVCIVPSRGRARGTASPQILNGGPGRWD